MPLLSCEKTIQAAKSSATRMQSGQENLSPIGGVATNGKGEIHTSHGADDTSIAPISVVA
jgi:hypothetical protein